VKSKAVPIIQGEDATGDPSGSSWAWTWYSTGWPLPSETLLQRTEIIGPATKGSRTSITGDGGGEASMVVYVARPKADSWPKASLEWARK
jgi:hypothetical protein